MISMTTPKRRSKVRTFIIVGGLVLLLVGGFAIRNFIASHAPSSEPPPEPLAVGIAAPSFTATDTRGTAHSLGDYRGKWLVLEWFNHECPYTKKHYKPLDNDTGNTQALQHEYTKRGVVWLSIVSSAPGKQGYTSAEEADELTRKKGAAPTAVIRDTAGVLGRLYGARNTPQYAIVDPDGVLRYSGAIDNRASSRVKDIPGATNFVRAALDAALAGEPIAVAQTQPYGCDVKY
jgi:peroxiredoxin